ncbi:uncharacterized protein BDV17DRAFT_111237 [Aspergillus undulatus]|uniref:uncharacterized protein n=1 Tax=Aspergillus undulatus TaxID=1810928 RepID=UPI003CCD94FB
MISGTVRLQAPFSGPWPAKSTIARHYTGTSLSILFSVLSFHVSFSQGKVPNLEPPMAQDSSAMSQSRTMPGKAQPCLLYAC